MVYRLTDTDRQEVDSRLFVGERLSDILEINQTDETTVGVSSYLNSINTKAEAPSKTNVYFTNLPNRYNLVIIFLIFNV